MEVMTAGECAPEVDDAHGKFIATAAVGVKSVVDRVDHAGIGHGRDNMAGDATPRG